MRREGALLAVIACLAGAPAAAECAPDVVDIRSVGSEVRFSVELADTPETRARGLMYREELPRSSGMLFIYDTPQRATFWMENTPLPLDMLFFDETGVLAGVHENAEPFSRDVIDGRPRGVLTKYGISRVRFRDMAHRGELPGITKSSW